MRIAPIKSWALAAGLIAAAPALAQKMPDIGFDSVGRGRPLAASVLDMSQEVGPNWIRQFRPGEPGVPGQSRQAGPDPKPKPKRKKRRR